jgi:sterol desaturase/sphingolipid hydroxylase (fatty acid hydroxylase superfamily)
VSINAIRGAIFFLVFFVMLFFEWLLPRHPLVDSKPRRLGINLSIIGLDILAVRLVLGSAAIGTAQFAQDKGWGILNYLDLPSGFEMFVTVVFLDLMVYLQHILTHMVPLFWRFHIVHHSDLDLDVSSGLRFHPVEIICSGVYKIGLILALGPAPVSVMLFEAILNGMAQFSHSNVKLPDWLDTVLRWVFVTPDMHRIHHSVEWQETNSNYGFNLSIWDRLLGTYIQEASKPQPEIIIGVSKYRKPEDVGLLALLLMPFRKASPNTV